MELVMPQFGLFFWTVLIFLTIFFLLKKFAWKPILEALKEREKTIETSLKAAEQARLDMQKMTATNEKLLNEARLERDKILKEAHNAKENIVSEAKNQANIEANKIVQNARQEIELEKNAALSEMKNLAGKLAIDIAEKVLQSELESKPKQEALVQKMLSDIKLN